MKSWYMLGAALFLTACGGGGSSSSNSGGGGSPPEPLYGVGGTVTGAVNPGLTLENNGGDSLPVAGTSFEFATELADGASYAVTVAAHPDEQLCSLANASGSVAGADVDNVEVLCRYWRTAALIESGNNGDAFQPKIAFDGAGNAIAVWRQQDGTYLNIYANRYTASTGSWGTEELIESGANGHAVAPQIAVDGAGNAIAVWSQDDGANYNIYANRYTASTGTWGTEELIESSSVANALSPQIAVDGNGNAIAVWQQSDGNNESIYANRYTASTDSWGTAELIESDHNGQAVQSQIAFDSAGNAIAVWSQSVGAYNNIYSNRYTLATGWGGAELVATGNAGNATHPQIASDSNGNAIAVWLELSALGAKVSVYANRYTASAASWGAVELLESSDDGHAYDPRIAMDDDGNGVAVWWQPDSANLRHIYSNRYTPGAGWGTEERIENSDDGHSNYPQIAIDGEGNVIAVWRQDDNINDGLLYANRYTANTGSWGTEALIGNGNGSVFQPQIAIDGEGNAIAVWHQFDGTHGNIHANRFE
ncbi:hypothetical protein [uncultured Spongiibacter sp.]|uniref:hypothetical protein n=1 Tax=uncultured Spongiibacter sp. TaxID=870896 RepID=UPI00258C5F62|nr:hypothetical protein [uncultured Spongiibacter sp.]